MADESKFANIDNQIGNLKDEIRNIKVDYIKKDDISYNKYLNKVDNLNDTVNILKTSIMNVEELTKKNTTLSETINTTNVKLTTLLETYSEDIKEVKTDVKGLKVQVNEINVDTSKNTDIRVGWKQILITVIITVISFILGASLMIASGKVPTTSLNQNNTNIEEVKVRS